MSRFQTNSREVEATITYRLSRYNLIVSDELS